MKTINQLKRSLILVCLGLLFCVSLSAQLRINQYGHVTMGYNVLSGGNSGAGFFIGEEPNKQYGEWGVEALSSGGLNIWRPYPNPNYGNYFLLIRRNGNVGIGKDPSHKLDVNGSIAIAGVVKLSSDARLKSNIKPLKEKANKLYLLEAKSYTKSLLPANTDSIDNVKGFPQKAELRAIETKAETEFGFLAQDLKEVFPELVDQDKDGYYSVNYIGLIPVIVETLKEQQQIINKQTEVIQELKTSMNVSDELISLRSVDNLQMQAYRTSADVITSSNTLSQNKPNPFSEQTEIAYSVAEDAQSAFICIFDMSGKMLLKKDVATGNNSITIEGATLDAGMYLYSLIVDGQEIATKKMILTK